MNRFLFFFLTGLSTVVFGLMVANLFLNHEIGNLQAEAQRTQVELNQDQAMKNKIEQLAARIYLDAQKTQDEGLKDIVSRQNIKAASPAGSAPDSSAAIPN